MNIFYSKAEVDAIKRQYKNEIKELKKQVARKDAVISELKDHIITLEDNNTVLEHPELNHVAED